jgi:hypothetical protein
MRLGVLPAVRLLISRATRPAILLALALCCAVVSALCWYASRSTVSFYVHAARTHQLQVFHSADGAFSEQASRRMTAGPGADHVRLLLPGSTEHLRFDPLPGAPITVCNLRIDGKRAALRAGPANQADTALLPTGCLRIIPRAGSTDPYVPVAAGIGTSPDINAIRLRSWVARGFALAAAAALLLFFWRLDRVPNAASAQAARWFDGLTRRAHWLVLVAMVVMGSVYAHLLPPNGVPDEVAHISKVAKMEAGALLGDASTRPTVRVLDMYGPFHDIVRGGPFTAQQFAEQRAQPLACDRRPQQLPTAADHYAPHLYLAPAATLAAACATGMSFGGYLTLSRILNLLAGALLVAVGVRFAGYGKWALVLVALLPMTLAQVASLSADSLTLGMSLCFIGLVSGIASGDLQPRRVRIALPVLALGLAFAKPGSAWILVSLLFCREAYRQDGTSFLRAVAAVVVVPWLLHLGWTLFSSSGAEPFAGVDPARNLHRLIHDPASVAGVLLQTFSGASGLYLLHSAIGLLGWLDIPLSASAYAIATLALGASLFTNPRLPSIPVWVRVVAAAAAVGSLVITALPLFLYWTYADSPAVMGLQGRYFLPTLAFCLVWAGLRAPPIVRLLLLTGILLAAPALTFDAREHIGARYYAAAL